MNTFITIFFFIFSKTLKMLSNKDFSRLINDPRLGLKKNFFNKSINYNLQKTNLSLNEKSSKNKTNNLKSKRCNNCESCIKKDCGNCFECLDKRKFGGRGLRKKRCIMRGKCIKFQNNIFINNYTNINSNNIELFINSSN